MTRPLGSCQHRKVIVEADPLVVLEIGERGVGEAEIDRAEERPAGNRSQHEQHRDQE